MKTILALIFCLSSTLLAFDIPKGSHNLAQLEEAQKNALKQRQALSFIITEKEAIAT